MPKLRTDLTVNRVAEFRAKYRKEKQKEQERTERTSDSKEFIKSARGALIFIFLFLIGLTWEQATTFYYSTIRNSDTSIAVPILNFVFALLITIVCLVQISAFFKIKKTR
ncbi:hypothetical protein HZA33_01755 [Candidatus Pacearchaeota archaeon]|nr:hypothetical protein [Candidatus Pacearchaeota archaeon]